jgi:hypothetical protein
MKYKISQQTPMKFRGSLKNDLKTYSSKPVKSGKMDTSLNAYDQPREYKPLR